MGVHHRLTRDRTATVALRDLLAGWRPPRRGRHKPTRLTQALRRLLRPWVRQHPEDRQSTVVGRLTELIDHFPRRPGTIGIDIRRRVA